MSADLSQQIFYTGLIVSVLMGALYWLLRHFKKRTRKEMDGLESDGSPGDAAFNSIAQTDRIMQFMKSQGVNVSGAQVLLESARRNYRSKDYNAAIEYCKMARKSMMDSKNQIVAEQSTPEGIRSEELGDEARSTITIPAGRTTHMHEKHDAQYPAEVEDDAMTPKEMEQGDEEQEEMENMYEMESRAQDALGRRSNKLPSKFMIQRALEAIQQAEKAGRPTDMAIEALDIAEEAFERETFDKALSYANRARKIAEGEEVEPAVKKQTTPKTPAMPEQKPSTNSIPTQNKTGQEMEGQTFVCPSCQGDISYDDVFCRHCGAKMLEEMLLCPNCEETIPLDSMFCPKCGTRLQS